MYTLYIYEDFFQMSYGSLFKTNLGSRKVDLLTGLLILPLVVTAMGMCVIYFWGHQTDFIILIFAFIPLCGLTLYFMKVITFMDRITCRNKKIHCTQIGMIIITNFLVQPGKCCCKKVHMILHIVKKNTHTCQSGFSK